MDKLEAYKALLEIAGETIDYMNRLDKQEGFLAPPDCILSTHLRTAISAVNAGGNLKDWGCVADGQIMLEELLARILKLEA